MSLVSVVIPAYNAADTLGTTLASVRAQTWRDLEIIVVDDGSTDNTAEIARRHAASDPRVVVFQKPNGGVAETRNLGISRSKGAFIAPCDADDLWHPHKIDAQMRWMTRCGPRCGMVYTMSRTIDQQGRITGYKGFPNFEGATYLRQLIVNFVGNGSALLFRREVFDDVGGYPGGSCEDWHMQALVARRWEVGYVPQFLTGYRIMPSGISADHVDMKESRIGQLERILATYPDTPPDVAAAAEATFRARLAVVRLRTFAPRAAMAEVRTAMRLSPRAALETLFLEEAMRLSHTAVVRLLRGLRIIDLAPPGPHFHNVDPADPMGGIPSPPLGWLLRRLEGRERAFLEDSPGWSRDGATNDTSGGTVHRLTPSALSRP